MLKNKIVIASFYWTKFVLRLLAIIFLIVFLFGCKSTKEVKNNKLDITTEKSTISENNINLSQLDLVDKEIILQTANPLKPTIIIDSKGNTQTFNNVKSVTIKNKSTSKKDSIVSNKKALKEKIVDKSIIKESKESVSDAKNFKGIFISIAFIIFFILVIYLVFKFKK